MGSSFELRLCDTDFWDKNLTWNTEHPQLSQCFRDTLLVWLPASLIILAVICESLNLRKARLDGIKTIPWNWFNRSRLLVTFLLILINSVEICAHIYSLLFQEDDTSLSKVDGRHILVISTVLAPVIQASCYSILLSLYYHQRKAGLHTSATIWFYLSFSVICGALDFYSLVSSVPSKIYNDVAFVLEYSHFPTLIILFLLECRGDTLVTQPDLSDTRPDSPEMQASFFSTITLWWFNKFIMMGYRSQIHLGSLWKTLTRDQNVILVPLFKSAWQSTRGYKCGRSYRTATGTMQKFNHIVLVLSRIFWAEFLFAAFLKLLQDSLGFVTPMLLKQLLSFMKTKTNEPLWHGVVLALLMLILPTVQSLLLMRYFYWMGVIGFQIKSMLVGAIYRKALLLSGSSRLQSTSGEIVNLMAVDSYRFQDLVVYVNLIWSAPYQMIMAISLLYRELGWSVFAGVACMALVLPVNAYIANRIKFSQVKVMRTKDERVKHMNELLNGVKVIKLYAWENSFLKNLFSFRDKELNYLKRILTFDAVQTFLWQCSPFVVALVTFAVYVNVDENNVLDAEKAFVSISLFNLLRFPLAMLPNLVTTLVLTMVSARRLNKFLNSDELVKYVTRNEELEAIAIEGGTVSWSSDNNDEDSRSSTRPVLQDINLHIKPKSFVAIIGPVASGKSSLLASILGEMHRISGRFNVCKSMSMAYVPQQAWIQNMTVRDNILFGQPYNETRYKRVLSDCSLQADLDILAGGDMAEIGEKGINLSGGQKQRVSLSRACYSNSDIYLLDDPLSALDSHVAKHVFDRVLSSTTGLLRNKTRVLATNSLFVLPYVDHIVVLDEGQIVESGSYKDLMAKENGYLTETMRQHGAQEEDQQKKKAESSESGGTSSLDKPIICLTDDKTLKSLVPQEAGKLIDVERLETGNVGSKVYMRYFKAISHFWLFSIVVSLILASAFNVATNLWLSIWSSDSEHTKDANPSSLKTFRLVVYATLGGIQCLTVLTGSLGLSKGAVRASGRLHAGLLERVLHSPMTFFDTTPIGRIVNRFAKDIDVVDSTIPGTLRSWINCLLQVLSTLFVICYSFPTFLVIILPLGVFYYLIQKVFIVTTRQLKRLESNTRSPIYSHFSETLSGISTIRAYDCVERFVGVSHQLVDQNQSCSYPNVIANRWLSVRLEFFGNLITSSAALFSVYYKGLIGAGLAGLTISYSLNITGTLSWLVRMTSDLETHIVSVERILEYMNNKQEDLWIKSKRPPPEWPQEGAIQIQGYSTRYREDTDLVLKDVTITIRPREKIGIVGRTGSGKSSLSLSLFRILDPVSGKIIIDGADVMQYGLHDIRSKLTIIPQDPVLFSGSLRFNLDPLNLCTDLEIWRAIELAHLKSHVKALPQGLDHKVSEFGENFSVGQRQLICLARAILRKSKILVLDEATASVDLETDSIVQKTIRDIFSDCTIITIAHRLHTILDSDRILVLDQGRVQELDSPAQLISDPKSAFSSLIRDAGIEPNSIIRAKTNE